MIGPDYSSDDNNTPADMDDNPFIEWFDISDDHSGNEDCDDVTRGKREVGDDASFE